MTATVSVIRGTQETNLDDLLAQGMAGVEGLHRVPAKRGRNVRTPGRHGELHIPGKLYDTADLLLPLWVRGVNPDGTLPEDEPARLAFHQRVRALSKLFTAGELITIRHTLSDDSSREITGEVLDTNAWKIANSGNATIGLVNVPLVCADPFWTDHDPTTATRTLTSGETATLTEFADADAPMDDLHVLLGPGNNPRLAQELTAPAVGAWVAYDGIIAAGRKVDVDTSAWWATGLVDAGGTWDPATAPTQHIPRVRHSPLHARLFTLAPQHPAPIVRLTHTGGGTMTVSVVGRRRYLVP